jgi:uncharacterized protein (TIGR02271 family)
VTHSVYQEEQFMAEHIVAIFSTESAAAAAALDLENAGFSASAIRRYSPNTEGVSSDTSVSRTTELTSSGGGGFWAWLLGEEPSVETTRARYPRDEEIYERRAHAGETILSVTVYDDAQIDHVLTILHSHHPLEIEENAQETAAGYGTAGTPITASAADRGAAMPAAVSPSSGGEEVIPLAEENIEVGKRTIDRGTTRVRRYVVETPVEREVTLHGERVTIERRRPVDATVAGQAFEERTVEVRETEEVPVVEKAARVVEEVAIRKEETERTETVRDNVRREEVEITDKEGRNVR